MAHVIAHTPGGANNPPMIRLEPVTAKNYETAMALSPAPDQVNFVAPVVRSLADAYAYADQGARALVAMDDETLVGFVLLYPDEWKSEPVMNLVRLLVDQDYQGRGLGKAILNAAIEEARNSDPRPVKMKLSVVPENARAIHVYESFGFAGTEMEDGERVMLLPLA